MTAPMYGTGLKQPVFARGTGAFRVTQTVDDGGVCHAQITLLSAEDGSAPERWFSLACAQCGSELHTSPGQKRAEICEHIDVAITEESDS